MLGNEDLQNLPFLFFWLPPQLGACCWRALQRWEQKCQLSPSLHAVTGQALLRTTEGFNPNFLQNPEIKSLPVIHKRCKTAVGKPQSPGN